MKRIIYILFACMELTACQKVTSTDETNTAIDSIMTDCVNNFMKEYTASHDMYYLNTATPSAVSERLFEVWYDDGWYLILVNRNDTTVKDILMEHPCCDAHDFADLTDSVGIEWHKSDLYHVIDDTMTIQEYTSYTYVDETGKQDTMLLEYSEIHYSLCDDKFCKISQTDTIIRHYDRTVKCYFEEFMYNQQLHWLYNFIMEGNYISDEQLLDAMPTNREQFFVFASEHYPFNNRSLVIDSIAIARSKDNPLFRDAYIRMFPWSDGATAEVLYECYYPMFFHYDSVYFQDAIQRIVPEYIDYFDDEEDEEGWLRWTREHREKILSW